MICDEDPLRRRPRESTARRKRQERCVWMARKMTEWPSKRGPITKIMPSDGCIGDTVPLAVGKWYDFHEFGWYMGNVGLKSSTVNSFCPLWRGRADILRNPSALNSRPTVVSSTEMRNSSNIQCARSFRRQRTTPWIAGTGPLSTSRASACRCLSLSLAGLPVALPSIRPSGPLALKRRTQSRTTWSPTVPIRAAAVRRPPS